MKKPIKLFATTSLAIALATSLTNCSNTESNTSQNDTSANSSTLAAIATPKIQLEKFELDNGLEVILHQDKSDPIIAAAIVYHVGSNREKVGKTGFAHFFEHMLFQNSENVGAGQFIKNIGAMGGSLNGGTWYDGTIYYEVFPKNALEQVLWMESDRIGYFINTITQAGLENEKQVVKNEKRQRVDNRPYGHTNAVIAENLYPEGHPYSWSVIGSLEDLQNATLSDVREFYERWYGINNATLVLAGDFESVQAKAWIEKYFGEFKPRGDVTPLPPMPAKLDKTKSFYHEDNFAKVPEFTINFPTVEHYTEDAYALELLALILSDDKQSELFKQVVEKDKLSAGLTIDADHYEIAGTFSITVRAFDNVDLDRVQTSINTALNQFAKKGFSQAQYERILTQRISEFYNNITGVFNKAALLARYNEFAGDPNLLVGEIDRYKAVTPEKIMAVFNKYVLNQPSIITSFVPKGQVELAVNGAIKADIVEEKIVQGAEKQLAKQTSTESQSLPPVPQTPSKVDRSIKPDFAGELTVALPDVWQKTLSNDIKVVGIEHNELPLVSFSIRVMGGHSLDKVAGTANLLTQIMMEGTQSKTPEQLAARLGELGSELSFTADQEFITLSGTSLSANFAATMALAQEILMEPRWDKEQWQRIKRQTQTEIIQNAANPDAIAQNALLKLLYSKDSMLSQPVAGNVADVESITLDDAKAFYQANISANVTAVQIAGDITPQQVVASLKPLSALKDNMVKLPTAIAAAEPTKPSLYFIDVPNAKQSVIHIGRRAMAPNHSDFYRGVAVNHNLGGSFSAQLFQVLRLQKGYTYGAYSQFVRHNGGSFFYAGSNVRANVTLESVQEFQNIMSNYVKDFNQKSLLDTQSILAKSQARNFETTDKLRQVLQNITSYDLANDYVAQQQKTLKTMELNQAKRILNRYMVPDNMIYLIVGDAKTQLDRLEALGLGKAQLLDVNGDAI